MSENSDSHIDWNLATFEGFRRWAELPLKEVILAIEENGGHCPSARIIAATIFDRLFKSPQVRDDDVRVWDVHQEDSQI